MKETFNKISTKLKSNLLNGRRYWLGQNVHLSFSVTSRLSQFFSLKIIALLGAKSVKLKLLVYPTIKQGNHAF